VLRLYTPRFALVAAWLFVGCLVGCSSSSDPVDAVTQANSTNMRRLTSLYMEYQSANNWRGPEDEAKFKKFIQGISPPRLARVGVDANKLDELFVSERDGQPFKIRYKVLGEVHGSSEPVVFEAIGDGGTRMVGFLDMQQREVDAAEYDRLFAGGK
jgi:hypothetical protein